MPESREPRAESREPRAESRERIPPRLLRVLPYVAEGLRNREIAEACCLTEHTVEKYVSELLAIFGCRSRTELAAKQAHIGEVSG